MPARALKTFWMRKITNTCNATELVQYGNILIDDDINHTQQ